MSKEPFSEMEEWLNTCGGPLSGYTPPVAWSNTYQGLFRLEQYLPGTPGFSTARFMLASALPADV
jgi:hypothetical protein